MHLLKRINSVLHLFLVTAIAIILLIPFSAAITHETSVNSVGYSQVEISKTIKQRSVSQATFGSNILVTPYIGDDLLPSITVDQFGHVVITWTNVQSATETNWGMAYSHNPTDQQSWFNEQTNVVLRLLDPNPLYFTTAFLNTEEYLGLWGVYISSSTQSAGFYRIPDITVGYQGWDELYVWDKEFIDPVEARIVDSNHMYTGKNYPHIVGPWNFYVYHYQGIQYDIVNCPVFMRTDNGLNGGVSYFDGQTNEKTAPAKNCDYVNLDENMVHMVIENSEEHTIIWKKLVMDEEPDIEYTPYQKIIANGTEPSITGNEHRIVIVYEDNGEIICAYSIDEGEHWDFSFIGNGTYPDVVMVANTLYAAYIADGNLYKVISTDGGVSWREPERINDVDGTVVEESRSVALHRGGIVWVDNRSDDYDIYYTVLSKDVVPSISITEVTGGIKVSAVIENQGDTVITDIDWSITIDGTIFFGGKTSGNIEYLAIGESTMISSGFPLGFGNIDIAIMVKNDDGLITSVNKHASLLLFFIIGF